MSRICGFTGYRPQKLPYGTDERHPDCIRLKAALTEQVQKAVQDGFTHFICGGALGADTFAAEVVLAVQKDIPNLILEIAVPFWGQERTWSQADQIRYQAILHRAQHITYLSDTQTKGCYYMRNRYIVDHAERLIAVFDGQPGGTAQTVRYAEKRGREVIRLCPRGRAEEDCTQLCFLCGE